MKTRPYRDHRAQVATISLVAGLPAKEASASPHAKPYGGLVSRVVPLASEAAPVGAAAPAPPACDARTVCR